MHQRGERHLTEAEGQQLDQRLLQVKEALGDATFKVVVLGLFDGLVVVVAVLVGLCGDRSGPLGICAGLVAVGVANLVLVSNAVFLVAGRHEHQRLLQVRSEDVVRVEQVEATGVVCLQGERAAWYVFTVGEDRLWAVPAPLIPIAYPPDEEAAAGLPACFEVVFTRRDCLHLATLSHGHASLTLPLPTVLRSLFPDPQRRRHLETWLNTAPGFAGRLDALVESLNEGAASPPAEAVSPLIDPADAERACWSWGQLQARIEERFRLQFEPGQMAAELRRLRQERATPACARDLLELVWRRLPPEAHDRFRPLRPRFCRLRAALIEQCGVEREQVRPSARVEDLLPQRRRADHWSGLGRRLGRPLPDFLARGMPLPAGIAIGIGLLLVYAVGIPAVQAIDAWSVARGIAQTWWFRGLGLLVVPTSFLAAFALVIVFSLYLFRNWPPLVVPVEYATVADLVRYLAATGDTASEVAVPWTEAAVWRALRLLLAEGCGRFPNQVAETDRLAEDLGFAP